MRNKLLESTVQGVVLLKMMIGIASNDASDVAVIHAKHKHKRSRCPLLSMDRSYQKNGLNDIRGQPKKQGAGRGNWGSVQDEIEQGKQVAQAPRLETTTE